MASVGSLSAGTSTNLYGASVHGFTGLASGMDVDGMIEGMTYGTRSKIAKHLQNKQTLEWQQTAYRSISSKLIDFNSKYISLTAKNSLYRSSTFDKNIVTANGVNNRYLSVTGTSSMLEQMSVLGIKQMAKDAMLTTTANASMQALATGTIDFSQMYKKNFLEGESLSINFGGANYTVRMPSGDAYDYETPQGVADAFNKAMQAIETQDGNKLSDHVEMRINGGHFELADKSGGTFTLKLMGGSDKALSIMGFGDSASFGSDGKELSGGVLTGTTTPTAADLFEEKTFAQFVAGRSISFSLNGTVKEIKLPEAAAITDLDSLKTALQDSMDQAFGSGKVTVGTNGGGLTFQTSDPSSVLRVTRGDSGLLGTEGALKMAAGSTNHLSLGNKLEDSGLAAASNLNNYIDPATGEINLSINGVKITGLTKDSSVADIIASINNSNAGVTVNYLETADKFVVTSKVHGSAGSITFDTIPGANNFAAALFGTGTVANGQDAIMTVEYPGGVRMDITRDTNTFNLEGATFTLNGEFGFDKVDSTGAPTTNPADYTLKPGNESVTFRTSVDSEGIAKTVSEMIDAYNEMIKEIYGQTATRPNRDYKPLTDEQKKEMSESEIKAWEEKAKQGILFNDSILTGMGGDMRFVFSGVADIGTLEKMGITISGDYSEHGKVTFDEDKFKAALTENPERVKEMFTKSAEGTDKGGFMARMSAVYDTYAKTIGSRKGLLIERAGSPSSALSMLQNTIQKQIDEIDSKVKDLKKYLQKEIDKYNSKFTQLEQLISQMNSQSSMLSGLGG